MLQTRQNADLLNYRNAKVRAMRDGTPSAENWPMFEEAYDELIAATPPGWYVGRPSFHHERNVWIQYAWDTTERPRPGKPRRREWETEAPTQETCIRSMAYALREIARAEPK